MSSTAKSSVTQNGGFRVWACTCGAVHLEAVDPQGTVVFAAKANAEDAMRLAITVRDAAFDAGADEDVPALYEVH